MSWLSSLIAWFTKQDPLTRAGELAAQEAERLWALDVIDPPGPINKQAIESLAIINQILNDAGWVWVTYTKNGPPQWCGMFAAACWRKAGLSPSWLATFWASTLRLSYWIRGKSWNGTRAGGPRLEMDLATLKFPDGSGPRRGDIVVVGDGNPPEGDHICVLVGYLGGIFQTISGNGGGYGPRGNRREGISKRDYTLTGTGYRVLHVYRPIASDLV